MPELIIPENYSPATDALKNKTVLITGAGDGLGKALSIRAAELGATVILLGRTVAKLEAVYDEIEHAGGPTAAIYPLDLSGASVEDYQQLAETIRAEFGHLDALVHCAATLGPMTPLARFPASEWQKTLQTNLTGPVFLTQACFSLLIDAPSSALIFTVDNKSSAFWGAYGVAKAAVVASMKIFADELDSTRNDDGQRIVSVNAIEPGPMRTQLRRIAYPGEDSQAVTPVSNYINKYIYLIDFVKNQFNGEVYQVIP